MRERETRTALHSLCLPKSDIEAQEFSLHCFLQRRYMLPTNVQYFKKICMHERPVDRKALAS